MELSLELGLARLANATWLGKTMAGRLTFLSNPGHLRLRWVMHSFYLHNSSGYSMWFFTTLKTKLDLVQAFFQRTLKLSSKIQVLVAERNLKQLFVSGYILKFVTFETVAEWSWQKVAGFNSLFSFLLCTWTVGFIKNLVVRVAQKQLTTSRVTWGLPSHGQKIFEMMFSCYIL